MVAVVDVGAGTTDISFVDVAMSPTLVVEVRMRWWLSRRFLAVPSLAT